ncbi:DUF2946 domain-containing protein [Zwartia hollandica]|jgi:hypothetical protein|uniref:DUF2946 domain-containing protein n=1 Tax=Zwartia hollandica TaxID=324606 RepID=UPI002180B92C|nr:DUF2946 domain-containing protein [Zwartia hollandica]
MNLVLRTHKRILSSIALLVMLFNLCAPALSHVVLSESSGQDFLVEVCTTTGTKFIKLDRVDSESTNHSSDQSSSECAYCALNVHSLDRPPAHFLGVVASSSALPSLHPDSPLPNTQARWVVNAPRAPPISL